ncbi:MAG: hypothetical protein R2750_13005 [Bacteroidales bacterium]
MQNKDLGVDKEDIVVISLRNKQMTNNYESLKAELAGLPGVLNITGSSAYLGNFQQRMSFLLKGKALMIWFGCTFICGSGNYLDFFKNENNSGPWIFRK